MKTLHLYVLRQALSTLAMTVCVFAFVLLLGNVLREILNLLVNRQASSLIVVKAIALLLPWIMAYVLPFALLTAMLLLFGRLSADNELTAIKASGISLLSVMAPLLIFAILMSGICAWFNLQITPQSRVAYKRLFLVGLENPENLITEDRFIEEIPNVILYVRKKRGNLLEDVCFYEVDKNTKQVTRRTTAAKAKVTWNLAAKEVTFELTDGIVEELEWKEAVIHDPGPALAATNLVGTNLLQNLLSNVAPGRPIGKSRYQEWHPGQFGGSIFTRSLTNAARSDRGTKISEMTFRELQQELAKRKQQGVGVSPVLVQMHRQVAFSFASFAFTLVAIPLGIQAHRRETSIGMALALALVLVYYSFLILAGALETRERLNPHLIVWIPNLLFQTVGAVLLWRANRKG